MTGESPVGGDGLALFVVTCGPYHIGLEAQAIDRVTLPAPGGDCPWLGEVLGLGASSPRHGRTVFMVGQARGWFVDSVVGLQVFAASALRPVPGVLLRVGVPTWFAGLALADEGWILLLDLQTLLAEGARP